MFQEKAPACAAVCLTTAAHSPSLMMEKTFAAMNNPFFKASKILELNPNHPLFEKLKTVDKDSLPEFAGLLYNQALLIEGALLDDHVELASKIAALMSK